MSRLVRFDRYICNLGYATRSTVMKFVRKQNVTIKGKRVKSPGDMVNPDDIWINDKPIPYPDNLSIVLHKPRGYVTSRKREVDSKIIYDLLPPEFFNRNPLLIAAGRLDKWASGLVVMSQDHHFVQRLAAPKVKAGALGKVYHVQLLNDLTGSEVATFASGKLLLRSETKELKPAKIEIIDPEEKLVQMTLYEGRYHQIRRMLAAVKNKAISIHRVQVGPISLGNLPVGHWRILTPQEIESVWKMDATPTSAKGGETPKTDSSAKDTSSADVSAAESAQKVAAARVPVRKSVAQIRKLQKKKEKLREKREEAKFLKKNKHMKEELEEQLAKDKKQQKEAEEAKAAQIDKPKRSTQKVPTKVPGPKPRRNSKTTRNGNKGL